MKLLSYLGWGMIHERQEISCQDVIGYASHENGNAVAVLADGASGARYAREAAQANVDGILDYFRNHSASEFRALEPEAAAGAIVEACLERLWQQNRELGGCRRGDLSATVMFALWDGLVLTLGHLGDGMILVQDHAGGQSLFSPPEYRTENRQETWFTVSPGAASHLRLYHLDGDRAGGFLMTSDGAYGMLRDRGGADRAAGVLVELVRKGELNNCAELAELLYRLEPQSEERLDDWSFWIGCPQEKALFVEQCPMISMLREERERVSQTTEVSGCDHPT